MAVTARVDAPIMATASILTRQASSQTTTTTATEDIVQADLSDKLSSMDSGHDKLAIHSLLRRADFPDGHEADDIQPSSGATITTTSPNFQSIRAAAGYNTPRNRPYHEGNVCTTQAPTASAHTAIETYARQTWQIESTNTTGMLPGRRSENRASIPSSGDGLVAGLGDVEGWEVDSAVLQQGWDGPLYPWYGLQAQDWLSGNFS